jgi:hypothetical protein
MLQRKTPVAHYSEQERRVLLTGIPLHATSTRFGHPIHGGWRLEEIETAWRLLRVELLEWWATPEFDYRRRRDVRPWACRYLEGETDD